MLCCYQPEPPPKAADNADRCHTMTLLYRRYWLVIYWEGMQTAAPHITRAFVEAPQHGYRVPVARDRLHILSRAAFSDWYQAHWDRFIARTETPPHEKNRPD